MTHCFSDHPGCFQTTNALSGSCAAWWEMRAGHLHVWYLLAPASKLFHGIDRGIEVINISAAIPNAMPCHAIRVEPFHISSSMACMSIIPIEQPGFVVTESERLRNISGLLQYHTGTRAYVAVSLNVQITR